MAGGRAVKDIEIGSFAGIHNTLSAERIKTTASRDDSSVDLVEAVNVDIDNSQRLSRRPGQTMKVEGAAHSLWSEGAMCLFVAAGSMFIMNEGYGLTEVAAGLSNARMSYIAVNGRVYHSNGGVTGVVDEGRVRAWGTDINDIKVRGIATGGSMPAGMYLYAMTFTTRDGQESGTGMAQRIDLPFGGAIDFNWAVPDDANIVDCTIYISQPNGEVMYMAAKLDVEQQTYYYNGGERVLPLATQWLDAPPAGQALALHKGRIYIAMADVLYATTPLSYEHCDLRDYRAFDNTTINVVAAVEGGLFVGTEKAVYYLNGASFDDNTLVRKMEFGAVRGSLVYADGQAVTGNPVLHGIIVALFATADGIVMGMPDGSISNLTQERYQMPEGQGGAAVFIAGQYSKYLLTM
jgi:hypothetical protein